MRVNADFSQPAVVDISASDWIPSPAAGVERIMLDRIGEEVARATSIVRYAAGSAFARHEHAMGEEFLVLEGVFSDDAGDFPAGTYVRNPPGSGHAPHSEKGCRILVKLRQFDAADLTPVVIDTRDEGRWARCENDRQCEVLPLHRFGSERVEMLRLASDTRHSFGPCAHGLEIFLVEGSVRLGERTLRAESWLRFPGGEDVVLQALERSVLWVKSGHLPA